MESIAGLNDMIDHVDNICNVSQMSILEIGSWIGTSAIVFAKRFREVFCLDPFESVGDTITEKYDMKVVEKLFHENVFPHYNIKHIKLSSNDLFAEENILVLDLFDCHKVDIVYIDGDHHYDKVKRDIQAAKKLAVKFICGHDYERRFPGVVKAVNEDFGKPDIIFKDTSWLVQL